jgi:hypothetical protein
MNTSQWNVAPFVVEPSFYSNGKTLKKKDTDKIASNSPLGIFHLTLRYAILCSLHIKQNYCFLLS